MKQMNRNQHCIIKNKHPVI